MFLASVGRPQPEVLAQFLLRLIFLDMNKQLTVKTNGHMPSKPFNDRFRTTNFI
jgi:hypothetical protein